MKVSREIKTATLVLAGFALFIFLFSYLKGEDLFGSKNVYYTEFDYNALGPSAPVTIKGNKVGKIVDIVYDFNTGKTRVSFSVNPELKFSKNSTVRLYEEGLMGGNAITIIKAEDGDMAKPGDFLKSEVQPGLISSLKGNFTEISTDLDKTLLSADTLMTSLNNLVSDSSNVGLKATIAELNATLKSFKTLSYSLQGMIKQNDDKISEMLKNFETTSKNFAELSNKLKEVDIAKTLTKFDQSLSSVNKLMGTIEKGEGSLGKLMTDDKLYDNIESATKELELLLLDIKLHPARYRRILSKKEIPYQKPTEDQMN